MRKIGGYKTEQLIVRGIFSYASRECKYLFPGNQITKDRFGKDGKYTARYNAIQNNIGGTVCENEAGKSFLIIFFLH